MAMMVSWISMYLHGYPSEQASSRDAAGAYRDMEAPVDYSYVDGILPAMQVLKGSSIKHHSERADITSQHAKTVLEKVGDCGSKDGSSFDDSISAMASKALENLKIYQDTVTHGKSNDRFYKPFDRGDGQIKYDDFANSLNISSSGLGKDDSYVLASQLDSKKSGGLDYKNIYQNLENLIKRTKKSPLLAATSTPFVSPIKVLRDDHNEITETDDRSRNIDLANNFSPSRGRSFNRSLCSRSINQVLCDYSHEPSTPQVKRSRRAHSHDSAMRNKVRQQLKVLHSIIAHDDTPRKYYDDSQLSPRKTIGKGIVKSSIVNQMRGRLSVLHHMLKRGDTSSSGYVSFNEFCTAISSAGILLPRNDLKNFFSDSSSRPFDSDIDRIVLDRSLHDASLLCIDDFIKGCRDDIENNKISAESFSPRAVHDEDEKKIMKLLLRKTSSNDDPVSAIFNHIDPKNKGWFTPQQIQEGFKSLNVPLMEADYKQLFRNVKKNSEGKINIREFEKTLQFNVSQSDMETLHEKKKNLLKNKRYTSTYRSDDVFHNLEQTEYYSSTSKDLRFKELIWKKLQVALQTKNDCILRAFLSKKEKKGSRKSVDASLRSIPLSNLQSHFASEGIYLGDDDVSLLKYHLQKDGNRTSSLVSCAPDTESQGYLQSYLSGRKETSEEGEGRGSCAVNNDDSVTLEDMCKVLNISLTKETNANPEVSLSNPMDKMEDGGIFASAKSSRMAVTMYDSKYENMHGYTKGMRYFHLPQNVRTSKRQFRNDPQAHTYEPSKFWLLLHSHPDTIMPYQGGRSLNEPISIVDTRRNGHAAAAGQRIEKRHGSDNRQMKFFSLDDFNLPPQTNSYSDNYTMQKRVLQRAEKSTTGASSMRRIVPPSPPRIRTLKKQYAQSNASNTLNFY